ncbi:MAG: hypothetical protein O3A20_07290 [Planctomycetota bacterium]|nr:hypothetical protein [Planctomycetota bacterium]
MSQAPIGRTATALLSTAAAAAILAPLFVWNPGALDDVRIDGGVLALVVAAATLLQILITRRAPCAPPGTWLVAAALSFGLLPLLFVPWSENAAGLADRAPLLAAAALAGLAASSLIAPARVLAMIVVGCALASLIALLGALGFDPFAWVPWVGAPPVAPYTGVNHASELLTPLMVAAAVLLPPPRRAALLWVAVLLCGFHAGALGTLAGRLSITAGLGLAAWRLPTARFGTALLAASFVLGELMRGVFLPMPSAAPAATSALPPSLAIRAELTQAALAQIPERPIGIGLGRFEASYPEWRSQEEARLANNDWKSRDFRAPKTLHDDPLQLLLECGWLGGALLLAALLLLVRSAPAWFLAPLGAFAVHAVVRAPLLDNPPALALFALLAGFAARASAQLLLVEEPRRALAAGLLIGAGAFVALIPARGEIVGEWAVAEALDAEQEDPAFWLARATQVRPWDTRSWELRGLGYLGAALADTSTGADPGESWEYARRCFEQALARQASSVSALTGLVQVEMIAPDGDRARGIELLARAERLAGHHPAVRGARRAWLESVRALHEAEGQARIAQSRTGAGEWLLSASLTEARVLLLSNEPARALLALERAASIVPAHRALIERTARKPGLDDALLQELTLRLFPGWPGNLSMVNAGR